jgi:predicted TIM-barrel enzyme/uncharacterized protein (UPF0261 family)
MKLLCLTTLDSKHVELEFALQSLNSLVAQTSKKLSVHIVDMSTRHHNVQLRGSYSQVVVALDQNSRNSNSNRFDSIESARKRLEILVPEMHTKYSYDAILALGGSCGSSLACNAMQLLPIGADGPVKVCLSTMAGGNVTSFVADSDIVMVPSVCDLIGLNALSRAALRNAASLVFGALLAAGVSTDEAVDGDALQVGEAKRCVAISSFGNTADAVERAKLALERDFDCDVIVFHSTGSGGRALCKAAEQGMFDGVLDLTTTEMADFVGGGDLSAGGDRLARIKALGLPHVVVPGCIDMINFCGPAPSDKRRQGRLIYEWNAAVTLMRTSAEESAALGQLFADAAGPSTRFAVPLLGFSKLGVANERFHDAQADGAFLAALRDGVEDASATVHTFDAHINDAAFVDSVVRDIFAPLLLTACDRRASSAAAASSSSQAPPPPSISKFALPAQVDGDANSPRVLALRRLYAAIGNGRIVIGAGAGTGLSAKFQARNGIDLIIVYNSGEFRMNGVGSLAGLLPCSDANGVALKLGKRVMAVLSNDRSSGGDARQSPPVLCGVFASDPFRSMPALLAKIKAAGFAGIQNFPTLGLMDGHFRQNLEESGFKYDDEVRMVSVARQLGLLTTPYVFDVDDAVRMTNAGADVVVVHLGLTAGGSIGATTVLSFDASIALIQRIERAVHELNPHVIVLCHGGCISTPQDVGRAMPLLKGVAGFYGASSVERLPVELALADTVRQFKSIEML